MDKARVEAFSDGVLAVAITLLVLDLHIEVGAASLATQLRHEWPSFAAYLISFSVIGVVWVNHHALLSLAVRVDRTVVFLNLLLLMFITTIPFTTSTLAKYLTHSGADAHLAVLLYGFSTEGMAISFTLILRSLIRSDLLRRKIGRSEARIALRRFGLGMVLYPAITLLGLVSPPAMLVGLAVMAGFYIFEQTPILAETAPASDEL